MPVKINLILGECTEPTTPLVAPAETSDLLCTRAGDLIVSNNTPSASHMVINQFGRPPLPFLTITPEDIVQMPMPTEFRERLVFHGRAEFYSATNFLSGASFNSDSWFYGSSHFSGSVNFTGPVNFSGSVSFSGSVMIHGIMITSSMLQRLQSL